MYTCLGVVEVLNEGITEASLVVTWILREVSEDTNPKRSGRVTVPVNQFTGQKEQNIPNGCYFQWKRSLESERKQKSTGKGGKIKERQCEERGQWNEDSRRNGAPNDEQQLF